MNQYSPLPVLVLLIVVVVVTLASQAQAQAPAPAPAPGPDGPSCTCDGSVCGCCAEIPPPIGAGLCANVTWDDTDPLNLTVAVLMDNSPLFSKTVNEGQPDFCFGFPVGKINATICASFIDLNLTSEYACGCIDANFTLFVSGQFELGCFTLGQGACTPSNRVEGASALLPAEGLDAKAKRIEAHVEEQISRQGKQKRSMRPLKKDARRSIAGATPA